MMSSSPPPPDWKQQYYALRVSESRCFWITMVLFGAIFITWIVLALTVPPFQHPVRDLIRMAERRLGIMGVKTLQRRHPELCRHGEEWDAAMRLCVPRIKLPLALEGSIMSQVDHDPCANFYQAMCGRYIAEHHNENRAFDYATAHNTWEIERLVQNPGNKAVWRFFESCVGALVHPISPQAHRETLLEIRHALNAILGELQTLADVPYVLGLLGRWGFYAPFDMSIERDITKSELVPLFAPNDELTLNRTELLRFYERAGPAADLHGYKAARHADRAYKVVAAIRGQQTHSLHQPASDVLVRRTMAHLPVSWDWEHYLDGLGGVGLRFPPSQPIYLVDETFFTWLTQPKRFTLQEWQAYVEFSILYSTFEFQPDLEMNAYYKRHHLRAGPTGHHQSRLPHRIPRTASSSSILLKQECARITLWMIPGLVSRAYLDQWADEAQARTEVQKMTRAILHTFAHRINETWAPWTSQRDREWAASKLLSVQARVAEPNQWRPEPFADRISQERYVHNLNMVRRYRVEQNLALWRDQRSLQAYERNALEVFAAPLTTTNAYYSPVSNTITIFAGIMRQPFFDPRMSLVSRYATLGSVIAHELAHALDPHGIRWDGLGRHCRRKSCFMDDPTLLEEEFQCLAQQPTLFLEACDPSSYVDAEHYGLQTLGESVADMGLAIAFHALFDRHPELSQGDKQHFFMIYAQMWCASYDQAHVCAQMQRDVHPVAEERVNRPLRNMDEFDEAFRCHGGGMWKAERDRCKLF